MCEYCEKSNESLAPDMFGDYLICKSCQIAERWSLMRQDGEFAN